MRRVIRFDAPDRGDDVAVDAVGLLHRVELRLVFGEHLAALGEAVVVDQNVEIVPDRLGEFRLRIHQVHDAQIGREAGGEALESLPARRRAVRHRATSPATQLLKIRGGLADRGRRHQRDGRRRRPRRSRAAARCRRGAGRGLRRRCGFRAGEHVAEQVRNPVAGGLGLSWLQTAGWNKQRRRDHDRAGSIGHRWFRPTACRVRPSLRTPCPEGPVTVSNSLTKAGFCCRARRSARAGETIASYIRLCSRLQTGYQRAIKCTFPFHSSSSKAPDIP